jgi:hypothetical protein
MYDRGSTISVDGNGNVYVTGYSDLSWQGDENANPLHAHRPYTPSGYTDMVVLKLNSSGVYQWHTFYGGDSDDYGYSIIIDGIGNIYISGSSYMSWQGDGNANPLHAHSGNYNIVVLKLDSNGVYQWHTFYGSGGGDWGMDIAIDGSSNIYVTGQSGGSWQGDGNANPLHTFSGYRDIVVLKLTEQIIIATPAPTMTEWGMILLIVLLGIGSIYYLGRDRLAV